MSYRVGDSVFLSQGQVAMVSGKDPAKATIELDRDVAEVRKQTRHGYINGVQPERKEELLQILDEVKKLESPEARVEELQRRIEELKQDPQKNRQFVRYLQSEQGHLMNISGYRPRYFGTEEYKLR